MSEKVFLSLGSNMEREDNIRSALITLKNQFGLIDISPVYESEAVGFKGNSFLNLVVGLRTDLTLEALGKRLKQIEDSHGRDRNGPKFGPRTLDIDIVLYADLVGKHSGIELPRPELFYNAFVLFPMADLCPDTTDILTGKTYSSLARNFSGKQVLTKIDFS